MNSANRADLASYRRLGVHIGGKLVSPDNLEAIVRECGRRLHKDFQGFKSDEQELVTYKVLDGRSVLAVMPTGSGKSLTYQLPAYLTPKRITLVISPIKALMEQHAELPWAHCINSDTEAERRKDIWSDLKAGRKSILLVSPEMLARQHRRLAGLRIGRFVVDEVHCLSDWGHDFRPHYWWVSHFLKRLEAKRGERIPRLLLTATADDQVLEDIKRHFPEVADPRTHVRARLGREEIVLSARRVNSSRHRLSLLTRFLERQRKRDLPPGAARRGIVFNLEAVGSDEDDDDLSRDRLKADQVMRFLRRRGFRKTFAYASKGMKTAERRAVIDQFTEASPRKGQVTIVVATNAFGMGMDYDQVPFVCHLYPRPSVVEYWQQVGRAGRGLEDGHCAEALALYSPDDGLYAERFAKAPALDGLLNAFTIPLFGWMYVWKRTGADMCMMGPGGGKTRFASLLADLQKLGIVTANGHGQDTPRGTERYRVNTRLLRRNRYRKAFDLLRTKYKTTKKLRKVFRYLAVGVRSRARSYVLLDQTQYKEDRMGTVLQRLNRWVDIGVLERDHRHRRSGEVRLLLKGTNLTVANVKQIAEDARDWAAHKRKGVRRLMSVLAARSPRDRRQRLLRHFGERRRVPPLPVRQPAWLAR